MKKIIVLIVSLFIAGFSFCQTVNNLNGSQGTITNLDGDVIDSLEINKIRGDSVVWDDIRVPAQNTRINPLASEPAFEAWIDGVYAFHFDAANDSALSLHFAMQMPHGYKLGTDLDAHVHWSPTTTNTGVVVWKIEYTIIDINGTFPSTSEMRVNDAGDGTTNKHQLADLGDIDGSGLTVVSAVLVGRLTRCGEHPDDTYTGDAVLHEVDFHYQLNTIGSFKEAAKR